MGVEAEALGAVAGAACELDDAVSHPIRAPTDKRPTQAMRTVFM
jgi:hypothetical protein